jgi:hypothetical protein
MKKHHLDETIRELKGPTSAQITVNNQWAAVGLDLFNSNSKTIFNFTIDDNAEKIELEWDSNFSKAAMKEELYIAYYGGESLAWFLMSILYGYKYLEQTEIGTGVDYRFMKNEPNDNDLNFLEESHYVEISGIIKESKTNTLKRRIIDKHNQIDKGGKQGPSSVIVTLFSEPITIKEIHK